MKKRKAIYNFYKKKLKKYEKFIILPPNDAKSVSANHLFIIILKKK